MLSSKKWMVLCVTALVGFGTTEGMVTSSVFAAQKSGSTQIILPRIEKEWGLSVPKQVVLDKGAETSYQGNTIVFGIGRVAIVTEDGSDFKDSRRDYTFSIKPDALGKFVKPDTSKRDVPYFTQTFPQGTLASQNDMNYTTAQKFHEIKISTKSNENNAAPFVEFQVGVMKKLLDINFKGQVQISDTVSWTAKEIL